MIHGQLGLGGIEKEQICEAREVWFTAVATMTMDSLVTIRHAAGQV